MTTKEYLRVRSSFLITELSDGRYLLTVRTPYPNRPIDFFIEPPWSKNDYEQFSLATDSTGEIEIKISKNKLRGKNLIIVLVDEEKRGHIILRRYFPNNVFIEKVRNFLLRKFQPQ